MDMDAEIRQWNDICTICRKHKKQNAFTGDGCTNYRTSTLKRHARSSDHVEAVRAEDLQSDFQKAVDTAISASAIDNSIIAAMRTVFWMAMEDIPIKKYTSMIDLLKIQGCESLAKLPVGQNATYESRTAGMELQESVAEAIHEDILTQIKAADMYSILVDETTDIAICKQMIVYVRIVNEAFVPYTYFLRNITIDNPKSDATVLFGAIEKCLKDEGLNLNCVKGFGSDGALVMVEKHSGVATRVKTKSPHCVSIHCMAHRFNLATSQATKRIEFMKNFEKTMSDLYYYVGGSKSGNRKCELEEIQKVLDDPQVKIKECHEIRWIAFFSSVNAVFKSWASLVTFFKRHEQKDKKATDFRVKLTDYRCVYVLHVLMDVLPSMAQMSKVLQKQDVDVAAVKPALEGLKMKLKLARKGVTHYQEEFTTKLQKGYDGDSVKEIVYKAQHLHFGDSLKTTIKEMDKVRKTFCDQLSENIGERFSKKDTDVASAFHVFGLRQLSLLSPDDFEKFGKKELSIITDHYGSNVTNGDCVSHAIISKAETEEEWHLLKKVVIEQAYPRDSTKILWKLVHDFHGDLFPNLLKLAKLCLIMPYQTADCERGFSCQNGIKTARRNRLKAPHLNVLMTIKCQDQKVHDYDFKDAVEIWKKKKQRRVYKKARQ